MLAPPAECEVFPTHLICGATKCLAAPCDFKDCARKNNAVILNTPHLNTDPWITWTAVPSRALH